MKELKNLLIILSAGVLFACVFSSFLWGVMSIAHGTMNGKEWYGPSPFIFVAFSLIGFAAAVGAAAAFYDINKDLINK